MRIPRTVLGSFVVASAVLCVPAGGYSRQVGAASGSASSHVPNTAGTLQVVGVAKIPGDVSTLAAVLPAGNGAPQSQPVVNLTWKASKSPGVKYNVYRSGTQGECLKPKPNNCTKINPSPLPGTNYTDSTVQPGQSYFYVAKSVNAGGKESGPSNEAPAVISPP
jgi:hypothetical protein